MGWITRFLAGLASIEFLKPMAKRLLVILGVTAVSYVGVGALMDLVKDQVAANWTSLPEDVVAVLGIMKIPQAINVVLSAYTTKLTVMGLDGAGVLKRVLWRPGQQGSLFP
jgi:hypothetical protein